MSAFRRVAKNRWPFRSSSQRAALHRRRLQNETLEQRVVLDAYAAAVLADNPIVYYDLNEGSGTTPLDLSGNGIDGLLTGTAQYAPGRAGFGMRFTGANGRVLVVDNTIGHNTDVLDALAANNRISIEFWAFQHVNTANFMFHNAGADANQRFSGHVPWTDNNIYFDTGGCCANPAQRLVVGLGPTGQGGTWNHWVFVKDGNNKAIYQNTRLIASTTGATNPIDPDFAVNNDAFDRFAFGAAVGGANPYNGVIDDFAIYDIALTPAQIQAHYSAAFLPSDNSYAVMQDALLTTTDVTNATPTTNDDSLLLYDPFRLVNVARVGTASQSSTRAAGGSAFRAIDGNVDGAFTNRSVTHTNNELTPWWQVDLGAAQPIEQIILFNRTDCCADRLTNFRVSIFSGDPNGGGVEQFFFNMPAMNQTRPLVIDVAALAGGPVDGDYVRVQFNDTGVARTLSLAEVVVLASAYEVESAQGAPLGGAPVAVPTAGGGQVTVNPDGTFTYDQQGAYIYLAQGETATDSFTYTRAVDLPYTIEGTYLGKGNAALLGGDLTDPENDGDPDADIGYNATFAANDKPFFGAPEGAFNVFDNRVGGGADKWCCTAATGAIDGVGLWVSATFTDPYYLTHFTIASSNDTPARDPDVWEIQGSNDGVTWDTVFRFERDGMSPWQSGLAGEATPEELLRNHVLLYTSPHGRVDLSKGVVNFPTPTTAYTSFRYFVDSTQGNGAHSISELEFFGVATLPPDPVATITVTGVNDAPVADAGGPYMVAEGGSLLLDGSASFDPDTSDNPLLTYDWDVNGDGVFDLLNAGPTPTVSWAQLQALGIDDGPGGNNVFVRVNDLFTSTTSAAATLTLTNTPPTAAIAGPSGGVPGFEVVFTVSAIDPSAADMAAPFTYTINWGDGSPVEMLVGPAAGVTFAYTYPNFGAFTISATATDKDGGVSAAATHVIDITPVAMIGDDIVAGGDDNSGDRIVFYPATGGGILVRYVNASINAVFGPFTPNANTRLIAFGQGGNDQITVSGNLPYPAHFDGGDGSDYLAGGEGDDTLIGGDGNDTILTGGGNNFADGGAGNDRLEGRDGDDTLFGGEGNDSLSGRAGNDILVGGPGNDQLHGGDGDDLLFGGDGDDVINGFTGDDVILGGAGDDRLFGDRGNDLLIGGAGVDRLRGDADDDELIGGLSAQEAAIDAALAAMQAGDPSAFNALVLPAWNAWLTSNDSSGFGGFLDDGLLNDLTGGVGADLFRSGANDFVRDLRTTLDGDVELPL